MADRLGDHLIALHRSDWLARPTLESVALIVTADRATDCVLIYVAPRVRRGRASRSLHALAAALADVGGTVQEGFDDGTIRIVLPTRRRRTDHLAR